MITGAASPENRPAPLAELLQTLTPVEAHYRRNHFPYPELGAADWRLEITGAVERGISLQLDELRALPARSITALLECAGHRRTEYDPPVAGVQWNLGALSQATWTGTPLNAVLSLAGIAPGAVEIALHGVDRGPFAGVEGVHSFSRSLPIEKAIHPDTLLAWEMNGVPLPTEHGSPVRAIVPGWYAMDSVKWLVGIEVMTVPFRGPFQELDYRFIPEDETGIGERLAAIPVHSLIVTPDGSSVVSGRVEVRGIAWGGVGGIGSVDLSIDDGPWLPARVSPAAGPYERSVWTFEYQAPGHDHVLAVRATDGAGNRQPDRPTWNRRGYANHSIQRLHLRAV